MPNVVACYKWVIDESDVRIAADLSVDESRAKMKISDYDRNAMQAATKLAQQLQGSLYGLSYGDDRTKKSIKDALSRGLDELAWINDPSAARADAATTAAALVGGIKTFDDVSLVICADGSSDQFARQTAPRIAALLDWPVVTSVSAAHIEGSSLTVQRQTDEGVEMLEVQLPAVLALLSEIGEAPIPGLRQIMQASKKPQKEIPVADVDMPSDTQVQVTSQRGYAMDRKNVLFDASQDGWLELFMEALHKEGVR